MENRFSNSLMVLNAKQTKRNAAAMINLVDFDSIMKFLTAEWMNGMAHHFGKQPGKGGEDSNKTRSAFDKAIQFRFHFALEEILPLSIAPSSHRSVLRI